MVSTSTFCTCTCSISEQDHNQDLKSKSFNYQSYISFSYFIFSYYYHISFCSVIQYYLIISRQISYKAMKDLIFVSLAEKNATYQLIVKYIEHLGNIESGMFFFQQYTPPKIIMHTYIWPYLSQVMTYWSCGLNFKIKGLTSLLMTLHFHQTYGCKGYKIQNTEDIS